MNSQEKALARQLFKIKIHEANGDKFEDLFTSIQNYSDPGFQQIKPWGNIGDRKNDGYNAAKKIFYQVYAPEEIKISYPSVIKKLNTDFAGLKRQWPEVMEFYFVVNDKYQGVNADSEKDIASLISKNKLSKGGFITPKDLENTLFRLEDDQILAVTGFIPDVNNITNLDYSVLTEVIGHIMSLPLEPIIGKIEFPDWNEKILFNKLSDGTKLYLNVGVQKLGALNTYLANQSFLADDLQEKLTGVYQASKAKDWSGVVTNDPGDLIFWDMVKTCAPKNEAHVESAIITIIAKYFESCDVFERNPEKI